MDHTAGKFGRIKMQKFGELCVTCHYPISGIHRESFNAINAIRDAL